MSHLSPEEPQPEGFKDPEVPAIFLFNFLPSLELLPKKITIAIDGPAGAGKGTIVEILVRILNQSYPDREFINLDTGAMYRCVALLTLRHSLSPNEGEVILARLLQHTIQLRKPSDEELQKRPGRTITVLLDDEDVSELIRTENIGKITSVTAQHLLIREEINKQIRAVANSQNVIAEGRDMTTAVFPDAQVRIYLDAAVEIRALRRFLQLSTSNESSYEEVLRLVTNRDALDLERNLKWVPGVWRIDSSHLTPQEVAQLILSNNIF